MGNPYEMHTCSVYRLLNGEEGDKSACGEDTN